MSIYMNSLTRPQWKALFLLEKGCDNTLWQHGVMWLYPHSPAGHGKQILSSRTVDKFEELRLIEIYIDPKSSNEKGRKVRITTEGRRWCGTFAASKVKGSY